MLEKDLLKINNKLHKKYGKPEQENPNPDPLDILIATILSQNTNDKNSYKAYIRLKENFLNWDMAAKAGIEEIEEPIKPAGFSSPKARSIRDFLNYLKEVHGKISLDYLSDMSNDEAIESLTSHKGIGIKTASCVLMFGLHRNICPVDRHIFRVFNRMGIIKTTTPEKTSIILNQHLPEGIAHSLHANLIRFGREICRQSLPNCSICPLYKLCDYEYKNLSDVVEYKESTFLLLDHIQ